MIKRIGAPKIYRKFEERLAAVQSFRLSDCIAGGRLLQWDDLDPSNWLLPVASVSSAVGVKLFPAGRLLGTPRRGHAGPRSQGQWTRHGSVCVFLFLSNLWSSFSLREAFRLAEGVCRARSSRLMLKPLSCCLGILLCLGIFSFRGRCGE